MRVLSAIQASGRLHIGNYFGAIAQMLKYQDSGDLHVFIADYHALTTIKDAKELKQNTIDLACNYLSLGIDPNKSTFWVQSDVKEVLELYWILSSFTPMGLLERAHSYKDKVAKGISTNHALFSYPVLMAADILLYDTNIVPVGKDQIQHVEMTRDIAMKFNNLLGDIFVLPEFKIDDKVAVVPGIDGAKMSKSYKNTIDIFSSFKELKKQIGKIVTDSTPMDEPKDYNSCNIFKIAKLFLNEDELNELKRRYKTPGEGYGHFKAYLTDVIWEFFSKAREKREYYINHQDEVLKILDNGAKKAKKLAQKKMSIIREAVGIYR